LKLLTDAGGAELPGNPLRDQRVRTAISLAIDRQALAARAFDGHAVPTIQLVPAGFGGYDPDVAIPAADPSQARKLLAAAGYPDGFGMTIACTNDRYVEDARVCQVLGQMLERAGFHMQIETSPGSILFPRTRPEINEMPLVFAGQSNSASRDPTHVLSLAVHSYDAVHNVGESNRGNFSDPELDRLIDAAVSRTDPGREEGLHTAMMTGVALGGIIPLYVQVVLTAARDGFVYAPRMDEQTVAQQAKPAK
jgi:peptide/nickel transport system substrate-binding protein